MDDDQLKSLICGYQSKEDDIKIKPLIRIKIALSY